MNPLTICKSCLRQYSNVNRISVLGGKAGRSFSSNTSRQHDQQLFVWGGHLAKGTTIGLPERTNGVSYKKPLIIKPKQLLGHVPDVNAADFDVRVLDVATGWNHSLIAMEEANTGRSFVVSMGLSNSGKLGFQTNDGLGIGMVELPKNLRVHKVACGRDHSVIATSSSTSSTLPDQIWTFGNGILGQLGHGESSLSSSKSKQHRQFITEPIPRQITTLPNEQFASIHCGLDHTVLRTVKDHIWTFGWGTDGQLGLGENVNVHSNVPQRVSGIDNLVPNAKIVKMISLADFTLVLFSNGQLVSWGNSEYGQCSHGYKEDRVMSPKLVPRDIFGSYQVAVVDIAATSTAAYFLDANGDVYVIGFGVLGLGKLMTETLKPVRIESLPKCKKIFGGGDMVVAFDAQNELWTWGLVPKDTLGKARVWEPMALNLGDCEHVEKFSIGGDHVLGVVS